MFSFNLTKFSVTFALIFLLLSACRFWQTGSSETSNKNLAISEDLKSGIPFASKEPDQFQTEIVVTAGGAERKTFVARNGASRRYDFNFGAKDQLTSLQTDKNYLILPGKKIYAEMPATPTGPADDWTNFLTTEWLSETGSASFEKLETTGNLTKYRVRTGGDQSEIFIFVDETFGLPIKEEFYAGGGGQKTLTYTVELINLKLQTDENLFAVPADLKKVSPDEFQKVLRSGSD